MDHGEAIKSIIDIFHRMDYEEKLMNYNSADCLSNDMGLNDDLSKVLKTATMKEPKSFDSSIETAFKAQTEWMNTSPLTRASLLHKSWKALMDKQEALSKLNIGIQNEFSNLVDYFYYYSDLTLQAEEYKDLKPIGVVLVVLSDYSPFTILGATVPAALAAGCSLIILTQEQTQLFPLFLQELMLGVGLPDGVFNVVKESSDIDKPLSQKIHKVVCCGSYSTAEAFYTRSLSQSFSFFCPNNTSAFILESCDLSAAADKIFSETWGNNSCNMWSVSTVVVQETAYQNFMDKLKFRMDQFTKENKNCFKFKNKMIVEKINKIIFEAAKAGATIERGMINENEWGPTIIVNYQDQKIDFDVPVLKVLICRTAKEGVALLNNSRHSLGTSIWTEISSQALEIASKLICPNIWINCHGIMKASVPFQPSGLSGNCVFGGNDGLLEYFSFNYDNPVVGNKTNEDEGSQTEKSNVVQTIVSAQAAFNKWHSMKYRRRYMKDIAGSLENKELSEIVSRCAHHGSLNLSESILSDEFFAVHKKLPLGVVAVIVNVPNPNLASIISLIIPAMVFGNAVIVVLKGENSLLIPLLKQFMKFLPKNVLNIIIGTKAVPELASDPNVQVLWLYSEPSASSELLQMIKTHSVRNLKHVCFVPTFLKLFRKECLRNSVIWMTKVDQFP